MGSWWGRVPGRVRAGARRALLALRRGWAARPGARRARVPLGPSWPDGALVGLDTETTGVDVDEDRIVSAAVVRRHGGASDVTTWLLDPGVPIPPAATEVHGIGDADVRAHGRPPAAALEEIAAHLAGAVRAGEPLVAYNASFDLTLLDVELRRHGLPTLAERVGGELVVVLDPLVLDRHLDPDRRGPRRLADLCELHGVETFAAMHRADVDVLATLDVLTALARAHPGIATMPLPALHRLQDASHRARVAGRAARRAARGLPPDDAPAPGWPSRGAGVPSGG